MSAVRRHQGESQRPTVRVTVIRETNLAYHIEIAMAGVKDKESLVIQWMSPRTLIVQGTIENKVIQNLRIDTTQS